MLDISSVLRNLEEIFMFSALFLSRKIYYFEDIVQLESRQTAKLNRYDFRIWCSTNGGCINTCTVQDTSCLNREKKYEIKKVKIFYPYLISDEISTRSLNSLLHV